MLLAWGWWGARSELAELREGVAQQLRETGTEARDSRIVAKEAQDAVRDALARIGALEAKLLESQSQQLSLESLYQELSRSRDDWLLAEVEQTLAIAAQQLQLAGNVQAALVALQNADARLARSDRPQFLPLRRVIARDIERLKNAPSLDVAGMTVRIDQVIAAVDSLPLLVDGRPQARRRRQRPRRAGGGDRERLAARLARGVGRAEGPGARAAARRRRPGPDRAREPLLPAREPEAAAARTRGSRCSSATRRRSAATSRRRRAGSTASSTSRQKPVADRRADARAARRRGGERRAADDRGQPQRRADAEDAARAGGEDDRVPVHREEGNG